MHQEEADVLQELEKMQRQEQRSKRHEQEMLEVTRMLREEQEKVIDFEILLPSTRQDTGATIEDDDRNSRT